MPEIHEDRAGWKALPWRASEAHIVARWPGEVPLAALCSAGEGSAWARWSILASPTATLTTMDDARDALASIPCEAAPRPTGSPPFERGWIGWIGYDAGRWFEPTAVALNGAANDRRWPPVCLHRCEGAYIRDRVTGQWWRSGRAGALPRIDPDEPASPAGDAVVDIAPAAPGSFDQDTFRDRVARAVDYVHAGDVFQVNIARRVGRRMHGDVRRLFLHLVDRMGPWMGALIEGPAPGQAVLSLSPEMLWRLEASTRRITTRPIKGTAPATDDPAALTASEKDRAELMMIIDLMRNDFGRVCEYGSIRVRDARSIERHGSVAGAGVWHGVGTVEGVVRPGASAWDVMRACFPAGSITGAPKIRAMQIIDELEPVRRGPYCGSVGFVDDSGASAFNVAIRTAAVDGASTDGTWSNLTGMLDYFVGAGIVADSSPELEWQETCAKAAGFEEAIAAFSASTAGATS